MDAELKCNNLSCRKILVDKAVVVRMSLQLMSILPKVFVVDNMYELVLLS